MPFVYVKYVKDNVVATVTPGKIKRFNINDYNPTKTYSVLYQNEYYRAYIISTGETEEEAIRNGTAKRFRMPNKQKLLDELEYSTVDEDNTDEKAAVPPKKKTNKTADAIGIENYINVIGEQSCSVRNEVRTLKPEAKENNKLQLEINELKKKQKEFEKEIKDLRQLNRSLQLEVIDVMKELVLTKFVNQQEEKEVAVGDRVNGNVYLGRDVWLPCQIYDSAASKAIRKDYSLFIKEIAVAVFGQNLLSQSSVTGIASNRVKGPAKPPLDSTKLMAIHDIVAFRMNERGEPPERIQAVTGNINNRIAEKIQDILRPPRQPAQKQKENEENVIENEEVVVNSNEDSSEDTPVLTTVNNQNNKLYQEK
ncbi:unnamed protein product [Brassicogethes aeneus]|uniref:BEN domain-containing protein n=1 Tax=Brassicogethes aeneus TaxID=1431903 RepID=A0A9P0AXE3_BRAAE|nr:unnamed protein product [Brassicogethes aeneus]